MRTSLLLTSLLLTLTAACSSSSGGTTKGGATDGGGSGGSSGGDASGGGGGGAEVTGCDGAKLVAVPDDPSKAGPWPVGVKTVQVALPGLGANLKIEVWYPAVPGSEKGKTEAAYDIREWLPASEVPKVPDSIEGPPQSAGPAFRDLPLDDTHGPYPAVFHLHGTAAFRIASAPQTILWASRGFVVIAADHPGIYMADTLGNVGVGCTKGTITTDYGRDVDAMMGALTPPAGDFAFLGAAIDMKHVGIAGHSAGASAAAAMSGKPNVEVVMPLATGSAAVTSSTLKSVLIMAGQSDTVIPYASDKTSYDGSPAPKRLVGIKNTGHLVMSALCGLRNPAGKDLVTVGNEQGICGMNLANFLWDCHPEYIDQKRGDEIVSYGTTAALEETLHCADRTAAFAAYQGTYPEVAEFLEQK